jgi:hypothetical protein
LAAANAAYTLGIVFRGDIDIPVIDWRHYLQHRLDMHNSHPSFASRKRMLNFDGDASNQVIWFTEARPGAPQFDQTPMALDVMDEWMLIGQKPARAVDSCFATDGSLLYSGSDAWAGILDSRPAGLEARRRAASQACNRGKAWGCFLSHPQPPIRTSAPA